MDPLAATPVPDFDVARPHPARIYDFYLGGKDHWQADRQAAETILAVAPEVRDIAWANRAFLHRAVRHLARDKGVTQFLDMGTGIPASPRPRVPASPRPRDRRRARHYPQGGLRRQRPGHPRPRQRPAHRHRHDKDRPRRPP